MAPVHTKRVEALRSKRAQIDAQLAQLAARERSESRKVDTRRKILIGAVVLQEMENRPEINAWIRRLLDERLVKDRDRALFGLHPVTKPDGPAPTEASR